MVSARIEKKLIPLPRLLLGLLRSPFFFFFFSPTPIFSPSCHNAEPGFGTKNEERKSKTARKVGRVKERGGVGKSFSFPSPSPLFHFFALAPFFACPTSKIPFLGIFLFRTQTEMLATQATEFQTSTITSRRIQYYIDLARAKSEAPVNKFMI